MDEFSTNGHDLLSRMSLLDDAMNYAKTGLLIFPTNGKLPRTSHGFHDASKDASVVREWWTQWPDAGIGMPTGAANGIIVVDVDDAEGFESFQRDHGRLGPTEEAITPRGGRHLYFRHPRNGSEIRNATAFCGYHGLDVRGDGGYVVIPPSPGYVWEVSGDDRTELPQWFLALLIKPIVSGALSAAEDGSTIREGARNAYLASLAGSMRRRGMTADEIEAALSEVNRRCSPPLPGRELQTIARSIARYQPSTASTSGRRLVVTP